MATRPDERQEGLVEHGEDLSDDSPLLYMAVPLSQLPAERRETVELLAHTVNKAIYEETRDPSDPWPVPSPLPGKAHRALEEG